MSESFKITEISQETLSTKDTYSKDDQEIETMSVPTIDVPDYSYWGSQNTLDANIAIRNLNQSKKYCLATTTTGTTTWSYIDLNSYDTNDTWMSATSNQITITKGWLYTVVGSADTTSGVGTIDWISIHKNWSEWAVSYDNNHWSWDRTIRQTMKSWVFVAWDVIKLNLFSALYNYSAATTYLQVVEA